MFGGWISRDIEKSENDFDNLEDAKTLRDKNNEKLHGPNKRCGEHYGVIDLEMMEEIDCPVYQQTI